MNIVISSDLGSDPDDFFAICYLIASGINVKALIIEPGSPDQLAIAQFILDEVGLDIPIGAGKLNRTKNSSGSIHHDLLKKYKRSLAGKHSGEGKTVIKETLEKYPDSQLFTIGPPFSLGNYLQENPDHKIVRSTMQGGFLPYHYHTFPANQVDKMVGRETMPTFNMNGAVEQTKRLIGANIGEHIFIGKNVCHTILFTEQIFKERFITPKNRAAELFCEAANLYFKRHSEKKMHDPAVSVAIQHPEVFDYVRGWPYRAKGEWGTILNNDGAKIGANVNYDLLWEYLGEWK